MRLGLDSALGLRRTQMPMSGLTEHGLMSNMETVLLRTRVALAPSNAFGLAVASLLLTACRDDAPAAPEPESTGQGQLISAGDTTVLVGAPTNSGNLALGGGRLEKVGGCLGAGGNVIVWPGGTRVAKNNPLTIEIPEGGTFTLGDQVQLGGGMIREHFGGRIRPGPFVVDGILVPAKCAKHDIFYAWTT